MDIEIDRIEKIPIEEMRACDIDSCQQIAVMRFHFGPTVHDLCEVHSDLDFVYGFHIEEAQALEEHIREGEWEEKSW
jgi:hypothetical protein